MDIHWAIDRLIEQKMIKRAQWKGNVFIALARHTGMAIYWVEGYNKDTDKFDRDVEYSFSVHDLHATDWELY